VVREALAIAGISSPAAAAVIEICAATGRRAWQRGRMIDNDELFGKTLAGINDVEVFRQSQGDGDFALPGLRA
jgi:hypothetical protein